MQGRRTNRRRSLLFWRRADVFLLVALSLGCAAPPDRDDPLGDELRREVDGFVAEGLGVATTAETLEERSDLLWRWGNAWALAGNELPVRLPLVVQSVSQTAAPGRAATPALFREIDSYLRQLAIEDRDPSALGFTSFAPPAELIADSRTTVEQIYTAGSEAPRRGAVFAAAGHFMSDQGRLQNADPTADGFVSIHSDRADASFELVTVPWSGGIGCFIRGPASSHAPSCRQRVREGLEEARRRPAKRSGRELPWRWVRWKGRALVVALEKLEEGPGAHPRDGALPADARRRGDQDASCCSSSSGGGPRSEPGACNSRCLRILSTTGGSVRNERTRILWPHSHNKGSAS